MILIKNSLLSTIILKLLSVICFLSIFIIFRRISPFMKLLSSSHSSFVSLFLFLYSCLSIILLQMISLKLSTPSLICKISFAVISFTSLFSFLYFFKTLNYIFSTHFFTNLNLITSFYTFFLSSSLVNILTYIFYI